MHFGDTNVQIQSKSLGCSFGFQSAKAFETNDKEGYIANILRKQKEYYGYLEWDGDFLTYSREILLENG